MGKFEWEPGDLQMTNEPRIHFPELYIPEGAEQKIIDGGHRVVTRKIGDNDILVQHYKLTDGKWVAEGKEEQMDKDQFEDWFDDQI